MHLNETNVGCLEKDDFRLPEAQLQLQHDPDLLGNQRADRSACREVTLLSQSLYGSECTRKCCRDDIMRLQTVDDWGGWKGATSWATVFL